MTFPTSDLNGYAGYLNDDDEEGGVVAKQQSEIVAAAQEVAKAEKKRDRIKEQLSAAESAVNDARAALHALVAG